MSEVETLARIAGGSESLYADCRLGTGSEEDKIEVRLRGPPTYGPRWIEILDP